MFVAFYFQFSVVFLKFSPLGKQKTICVCLVSNGRAVGPVSAFEEISPELAVMVSCNMEILLGHISVPVL